MGNRIDRWTEALPRPLELSLSKSQTLTGQLDLDCRSYAVSARRKMEHAVTFGNRMPDRLRVISLAVSNGAKSQQVTHRAKKLSSGAVDALLSLPLAENGFEEQGQRETVNFP